MEVRISFFPWHAKLQQKIQEFAIILFGKYYRAKIEAIHYLYFYLFFVAANLFQKSRIHIFHRIRMRLSNLLHDPDPGQFNIYPWKPDKDSSK
jgi:hypothetical protein